MQVKFKSHFLGKKVSLMGWEIRYFYSHLFALLFMRHDLRTTLDKIYNQEHFFEMLVHDISENMLLFLTNFFPCIFNGTIHISLIHPSLPLSLFSFLFTACFSYSVSPLTPYCFSSFIFVHADTQSKNSLKF